MVHLDGLVLAEETVKFANRICAFCVKMVL